MFSLYGFVEVFGVETYAKVSVPLSSIYQAIHPGCWFPLVDLCDDSLFYHVVKLAFDIIFQANWHASRWMDHRGYVWIQSDVLFTLKTTDSIKAMWVL